MEIDPLLHKENSINYIKEEIGTKKRTRITRGTTNVLIAIFNVLTNVCMNVSLPVYAGTMQECGGDVFVLLLITCFFILVIFVLMTLAVRYTIDKTATLRPTSSHKVLFAMGLFTALNGVFVVFASPPSRTPPYLQGILQSMVIPYTILFRLLILRKGISLIRGICATVVLVGLFITTEPQIWGLDKGDDPSGDAKQTVAARILWPLCFAIGFIPVGLMNVFCEKELKKDEGQSFSFITWSQIYQCVCMVLLFWVDFIPEFGMKE
ncbi:hypothetical protein KUTeg_002300 [Tegillarca granosa]|uniref:Uncharacterized protein n=1 Tax=Tegillarca granosa TaxID=220873 RepID=A0ABQ9FYD3_TEGGR|nr:hypothetical protein KUTeg_002300 [Tegillarca granosa]